MNDNAELLVKSPELWYNKAAVAARKKSPLTYFCEWASSKFCVTAADFQSALAKRGITKNDVKDCVTAYLKTLEEAEEKTDVWYEEARNDHIQRLTTQVYENDRALLEKTDTIQLLEKLTLEQKHTIHDLRHQLARYEQLHGPLPEEFETAAPTSLEPWLRDAETEGAGVQEEVESTTPPGARAELWVPPPDKVEEKKTEESSDIWRPCQDDEVQEEENVAELWRGVRPYAWEDGSDGYYVGNSDDGNSNSRSPLNRLNDNSTDDTRRFM